MIAAFVLTLAAASVSGVVHDSSGAVVVGASVIVRPASGPERQSQTGPDGRFSIETPEGEVTLIVRAGGFAENRGSVSSTDGRDLDIEVVPARLLETVTVTPTRTEQRLGDIPASVNVLTSEAIEASPALLADDVLRQVPTFSLFRRDQRTGRASDGARRVAARRRSERSEPDARAARRHPVQRSVRRLGVLDARAAGERGSHRDYRGPDSSLYGNFAMGGVINIITSRPTRRTLELKPQYGSTTARSSTSSPATNGTRSRRRSRAASSNTDGFPIVAPIERGPIDNNADVAYKNITGKLEYTPSDRLKCFVRAGYFTEAGSTGKLARSTTRSGRRSTAASVRGCAMTAISRRACSSTTRSHTSTSSRSPTPRRPVTSSAWRPTSMCRPTAWAAWPSGRRRSAARTPSAPGSTFGGSTATARRTAYVASVPTSIAGVTQAATLSVQRVSGGTQQSTGVFVQDIFTPTGKLVLTLSARLDHWRNYDGHNLETTVATGQPTINNRPALPDKTDNVASPRAAALYHVSDRVSVWGAANSGFRAPTLTELYRQFSVGAVTTRPRTARARAPGRRRSRDQPRPDTQLSPCDYVVRQPRQRSGLERHLVRDAAQKQNLGKTRVRGIQTDAEYRLGTSWRLSAAISTTTRR